MSSLVDRLNGKLGHVNAFLQEGGTYACVAGAFTDEGQPTGLTALNERVRSYLGREITGASNSPNAFNRGAEFFLNGAAIVSPVCFHNSYWSKGQAERDIKAISMLGDRKIIMFFPSGPAEHNYDALGISDDHKANMAKRQLSNLSHAITRGIDLTDRRAQNRFERPDWEFVSRHETYIAERAKFGKLYQDSNIFRADVRGLTAEVLTNRLQQWRKFVGDNKFVDEAAIDEGVNYSLDELAYVAAIPQMFGVKKVLFTYHKDWPIFRDWADGKFDGQVKPQFGFIILHAVKGECHLDTPVVLTVDQMEQKLGLQDGFQQQGEVVVAAPTRNTRDPKAIAIPAAVPPPRAKGGSIRVFNGEREEFNAA